MAAMKRARSDSSPEAEIRPKKSKLVLASQPVITVLVNDGEEQTSFHVHANRLAHRSTLFAEKIDLDDGPTEQKPLIIDDVSSETFNTFACWIYTNAEAGTGVEVDEIYGAETTGPGNSTGDQDAQETQNGATETNDDDDDDDDDESTASSPYEISPSPPGEGDQDRLGSPWYAELRHKNRVFGRLSDLYIFAVKYDALSFRQAIMLTFQRLIFKWSSIPGLEVIKRLHDALGLDTPLLRFLVRCYSYYTEYKELSKPRFATLPADFLVEVLALAFARNEGDRLSRTENWCDFHQHVGEDDQRACEANRPKDPDVEKKRARRWSPPHSNGIRLPWKARQTARKTAPSYPY